MMIFKNVEELEEFKYDFLKTTKLEYMREYGLSVHDAERNAYDEYLNKKACLSGQVKVKQAENKSQTVKPNE